MLACMFIGAAIFGVINHFRNEVNISDEETPLADGDDYFFENYDQLSAPRVLNEIIIKFKDPADVPGKEKQLQDEIDKVKKIGFIEALGVYVVRADDLEKNPNAVLNRFKNSKFIEYIEPNYLLDYGYTPNDPNYKTQSIVLSFINAQAGWDITTGYGSPVVAVIDSGFASHEDLPEPYVGYSTASSLAWGNDKANHGTGVAGVLSAIGDNGIGSAGINWNANIMAVKVDDAAGAITVGNLAKAVIWAADNGAKVINLSLGMATDSATLRLAIDYAYQKDIAMFAATGNDGKNAVSYPARYDKVMGVGSSTNGTSKVASSNYGPGVDVVAVGSFYTTSATGGYASLAGTSFASPQAAGLASLMLAINPSLSNDEIYELIKQGAKPLGGGFNEQTGYGLIDIGKTLKLVQAIPAAPAQPNQPSTPAQPSTPEQPSTPTQPATPAPPPTPVYKTPPIITLNGFAEVKLIVGEQYEETGYTAVDCLGADISKYVEIGGSVNTLKAGVYALTYNVSDNGGNSAKATRTIFVEEKPVVQIIPPTITVIGSNPIVLHLNSKTPYTEQGAKAVDSDGKDISGSVKITGEIDRGKEGVYTITYSVTGKTGGVAAAARNVVVLAPNTGVPVRDSRNFSGQAKQGAMVTHTGIKSGASGYMDLKVTSLDKNMTIFIQFVDPASKKAEFTDTFSAAGSKQYKIGTGSYELWVTVDKANGNSKYDITMVMPEVVTMEYSKVEVAF